MILSAWIDTLARRTSLKNKIFFATVSVLLLISLMIALFTRWVLISSLTHELKQRGVGIAESLAKSARVHVERSDTDELRAQIASARDGGRRQLVAYIVIVDRNNVVLAHTFPGDVPSGILTTPPQSRAEPKTIRLLRMRAGSIFDIAAPIRSASKQIGQVHVGLYKNHIDTLIGKLRLTFLGFVSAVTLLFFGVSHWLARIITRPISKLSRVADEIGHGSSSNRFGKQHDQPIHPSANLQKPSASIAKTADARLPGDEVVQLASSIESMSRRIEASEKELRASELKYRRLFNSGPNPVFVLDRGTLNIMDANPRAEETYGYYREELIGRPFTDLGGIEHEDATRQLFNPDGKWRAGMISSKEQFYKKGHLPLFVNVHASPATYQGRDAIIVATTDISALVEKENRLIHASKMKSLGEMSAGVAHELNQPLNALKMGSDFLQMTIENRMTVDDDDLHEVVSQMSTQVDRAADIITRLREFGRKSDFRREPISLNRSIRAAMGIIAHQLKMQDIDVELALDETQPTILAHANRIEQVMFNLLTNARDAIITRRNSVSEPVQGRVQIRSFRDLDRVAVTVRDNGEGIAAAMRERIFEPFFTTKDPGVGMGLGLSILHGIITDYDGSIDFQSQEGRGTTFRLSFPAVSRPQGA